MVVLLPDEGGNPTAPLTAVPTAPKKAPIDGLGSRLPLDFDFAETMFCRLLALLHRLTDALVVISSSPSLNTVTGASEGFVVKPEAAARTLTFRSAAGGA
jgi:hypothetical protein